MEQDFAGRVALVTGGSTGIGRAVVDRLSAGGASVAFCTHDAQTLGATEDPDVLGLQADVRSADDMRRVVAETVSRFGGLDVLVCSAGIQTYGTAEETTEDEWRTVFDTNLTGVFLAAKAAIPELRRRGGGAIVNISSVQGITPERHCLGYSVSKAAVDAITRSIAVDHASDGIRANSVAPGPVDTPLLRNAIGLERLPTAPPAPPTAPPDGPRGRVAAASEIAELVAFLASDRASYLTGATYLADGGLCATPGRLLIGS